MKFKINSKFNIEIHNQYKNMIFTGFRDTDLEKKKTKRRRRRRRRRRSCRRSHRRRTQKPTDPVFSPPCRWLELTIGANGDQAEEEEEAIEDEDKEEAALINQQDRRLPPRNIWNE